MIWESHYWKADILKQATSLRKRKWQKRWSEASFARVEQTIMLGSYAIRKLADAGKLSNAITEQKIDLQTYAWLGNKPVTKKNWDKIDQHYALDAPGYEPHDVIFVCHQIVHSYVFSIEVNECDPGISDILFTSDRNRHRCLFGLAIDCVINLFEEVGNDYPNDSEWKFNSETQDFDVYNVMHVGGDWA